MITIDHIEIESKGFELKKIQDGTDLTTAASSYHKVPTDGGVRVIPKLSIKNIQDGFFYINQVCEHHSFSITTGKNKEFIFDSNGREYRDTVGKNDKHYQWYTIKENLIKDQLGSLKKEVVFYDAPFVELFDNWKKIEYDIKFRTYFQFSLNNVINTEIVPLISFEWCLKAKVEKELKNWRISDSNYSSDEEIRETIKNFDPTNVPIDVIDLPHLMSAVTDFKSGII